MSDESRNAPTGQDTGPQPQAGSAFQKLPVQVIESAGFVALVTAILYYMGYSYYAGFFGRLSLPPPFPELSTTDYLLQAFSSLSGLIAAAMMSAPYRLLVALARGGRFYLVEQQFPAPEFPVVYFVPESEVVSATMHRASPEAPPSPKAHGGEFLAHAPIGAPP